ncbi:hypothetical protein GCM10028783_12080 [Modestobacter muralis]
MPGRASASDDGRRSAPGPEGPRATEERRAAMSKRGRKRRARKKSGANHGKRPNA